MELNRTAVSERTQGVRLTFFSILLHTSNTHLQDLESFRSTLHLLVLLLQGRLANIISAVARRMLRSGGDTAHLQVERDEGRIANVLQDSQ